MKRNGSLTLSDKLIDWLQLSLYRPLMEKVAARWRHSQGQIGPKAREKREKIVGALSNGRYRARTVTGIAVEAGLREAEVVDALSSDQALAKVVKIYPVRSKDGRVLITTKDRFAKEASPKEKFIDFFASQRPWIADAR